MIGSGRQSEERFDPGLDDAGLLEAVLAHYRQALVDAAAVHAWLVDHGIVNGAVLDAFGLGFSDRTLGLSLPIGARVAGRELRGRLQDLGVLRASGHEQFRGCLVVPVRDSSGRIVQCYGHRVNRPQQRGEPVVEVLWFPAPATGVWHLGAMASAEVIVADSVLDGLVWWSAGYRHVLAPGGPDGLPDDLAGRCHPGAGNRPPRSPWPPQEPAQRPIVDDHGDADIDDWDRQAEALLAALEDDEPDT